MLTLVTGGTGHIGGHVVRLLLKQGRKVRLLVRRESSLRVIENADGSLPEGLELAYGDILDAASVKAAMAGVSRVYHLAAVFQTRFKEPGERDLMIRAIEEGSKIVCEAAFEAKVGRLVYTSSVAAMGIIRDPKAQPLDESNWNDDPIDAYVASKTNAERWVHARFANTDFDYVVLCPATVVGPGDFKKTPNTDFMLKAFQRLPPVYFSNGHSYVDAEDVAQGHLLAEAKGRRGERYILGGDNTDIRNLFGKIAVLAGKRPPLFKIGHLFVSVAGLGFEILGKLSRKPPLFTRAKGHKLIDYYGYFSSAKAQKELGYQYRGIDEILGRCQAWYQARGWLP